MDFTEFHNWIYREFNINLNAYKQEQLNRRIGSLMSRIDIKSLEDYKKTIIRKLINQLELIYKE